MMALARLQRFGHSPIAIVGGGTGMIGDPERQIPGAALLSTRADRGERRRDPAAVRAVPRLRRRRANPARIVNNADWLASLDLLGVPARHRQVLHRQLHAAEGVRAAAASRARKAFRITEFSYVLLQARDFLELFDRYGCTLQMGGSDQWGNITAGIDLIRKLRGGEAHGLVWPLVTTASGIKFGKTEAGAIWLDPVRTSPFRSTSSG